MKNKVFFVAAVIISAFFCLIVSPKHEEAHASDYSSLSEEGRLEFNAQNNLLFYNLCDSGSKNVTNGGEIASDVTGYDRLKESARTYGEFAMDMQRKYGSPWTMVIAQMQKESSSCANTGNHPNNCLGITGTGDAGTDGRFAIYTSVEKGIEAWAGEKVLRAGFYDKCFSNLDPNNYNLDGFIECVVPTYCPATECDVSGYIADVKTFISIVNAVAQEQNWPDAAALAKKENIPIGGQYAVGSDTTGAENDTITSSSSAYQDKTTWEDGWITSGFDGYIKEPAEGSGYGLPEEGVGGGHTQDYSTDGKPNKILLHSTEGGPGNGDSGLALYGSLTKGGITGITPAHFTINLQDKKVFQHYSINKPSDAIIEDLDAGIQIEIIGFMNEGNDPALPNFSDEDWEYLAKLLISISNQTGIELTSSADWTHTNRYSEEDFRNYTGVLGHMHAPSDQNHDDPGNIWPQVEAAIKRLRAVDACGTVDTGDFASYVVKYAWTLDELSSMGATEFGGTLTPKDGYKEAIQKRQSNGEYIGGTNYPGIDCGGFVTTLMNESGYEPGYDYNGKGGNTIYQEKWMTENWELVTSNSGGFDTSQLRQGDVYINSEHTFVFVGEINGFGSNIASASWDHRAPQASGNSATESGYRIYRKKG